MVLRQPSIVCLLAVLLTGTLRCWPAPSIEPQVSDSQPRTCARIHWRGIGYLLQDTNAAYQAKILQLPEAEELGNDLLLRLSRVPWTTAIGLTNSPGCSNESSGLLLSVLRPLATSELYLEAWASTNYPLEVALAARMEPDRLGLWRTNLGRVLIALGGTTDGQTQSSQNWSFTNWSRRVTLSSAGDWTLLGVGEGGTNLLVNELATRIGNSGMPAQQGLSNCWADIDVDLGQLVPELAPVLARRLPCSWPRVLMKAFGEGDYVKTEGELAFPRPLGLQLEPWTIYTNIIREPLVAFSALQGFRPWLVREGFFQGQEVKNPPNQLFGWALNLTATHTYLVAALPGGTNWFEHHGLELAQKINNWLTNQVLFGAEYSQTNFGIAWVPVPMFTPALQVIPGDHELLLARIAPTLPPLTGKPPPSELVDRFAGRTNLVFYDWEVTQARVEQWLIMGQALRLAFGRAQMPVTAPAMRLLKTLSPLLGNTVTEVEMVSPEQLRFVRRSHIGLKGFELHLLADWIESPRFPFGFHSDLRGMDPRLPGRKKSPSAEPGADRPLPGHN